MKLTRMSPSPEAKRSLPEASGRLRLAAPYLDLAAAINRLRREGMPFF